MRGERQGPGAWDCRGGGSEGGDGGRGPGMPGAVGGDFTRDRKPGARLRVPEWAPLP